MSNQTQKHRSPEAQEKDFSLFHVPDIGVLYSSGTTCSFGCSLHIPGAVTVLRTGREGLCLSLCSSPLSPAPAEWLLSSGYGFHSPSGVDWDALTPFSSIKWIISALGWGAADPSQGLGQLILHSPCNVHSCRTLQVNNKHTNPMYQWFLSCPLINPLTSAEISLCFCLFCTAPVFLQRKWCSLYSHC